MCHSWPSPGGPIDLGGVHSFQAAHRHELAVHPGAAAIVPAVGAPLSRELERSACRLKPGPCRRRLRLSRSGPLDQWRQVIYHNGLSLEEGARRVVRPDHGPYMFETLATVEVLKHAIGGPSIKA